jgi:hypothetical protein
MSAAAKPERGAPEINMERLVIETAPGQIRAVQQEIAGLERKLLDRRALLRRLLDTAVLYGVELCPAPALAVVPASDNGNAVSPGRSDGAELRGVN